MSGKPINVNPITGETDPNNRETDPSNGQTGKGDPLTAKPIYHEAVSSRSKKGDL